MFQLKTPQICSKTFETAVSSNITIYTYKQHKDESGMYVTTAINHDIYLYNPHLCEILNKLVLINRYS